MTRRPSKQGLSTGILVVLLAGVMVSQALQAGASHLPADKVNASADTFVELANPTTDGTQPPGEATSATPVELLSSTFKSSSPSDLMLHVTLECSIITDVTSEGDNTPSTSPETSTGRTEGRVKVWMTFDSPDPTLNVIPINTVSSNPQPHDPTEDGTDEDKVTFCNRAHRQDLSDEEEDEEDGGANDSGDGNDPDGGDGNDELRSYLRTKSANAFNWVYLNTGNGNHTVRLWAEFVQGSADSGTTSGYVGNRMLIVEPTKMSNHEEVLRSS